MLGKLTVPGRPTIWITVGQGPTALVVGAGGGGLDIFTLNYPFFLVSPSLWETARYRLKYCLKGPLNPKQPTNQPTVSLTTPSYIIICNHYSMLQWSSGSAYCKKAECQGQWFEPCVLCFLFISLSFFLF